MEIFKKHKLVWITFLVVIVLMSVGVTFLVKGVVNGRFATNSFIQIASVENKTNSSWNNKFSYLKGMENKKIKLDAGEEITIKYSSDITEGTLDISFLDSKLSEIQELPVNTDSSYTFKAPEKGTYYIRIKGDAAKGKFNLKWN